MTEENLDAAKRRQVVSFGRLERKVDANHKIVVGRLDALNLNGSAPALKRLAENADQLIILAQVAPRLVEAVQRDQEWVIFRKVLFRILNPLKPLGAFMWLLLTAVVLAVVNNHIH